MTLKTQILISVCVLAGAFAAGRYSVNPPKTVSTDVATQETDKNTHTETTTITKKKPTGEEETITTIVKDTNSTSKSSDIKEVTVTPTKRSTLNVSALIGVSSFTNFTPTYGISVNKEFLGPITLGVWGLTSGTAGVSIGLNF